IIIDSSIVNELNATSPLLFEQLNQTDRSLFPLLNERSETRIVLPVTHKARTWGVMILESSTEIGNRSLGDPDIHEFLKIVRRQLEIAVQFRNQHRELEQLSRIQNELFTKELDVSESLDSLIRNILFALPTLGLLRIPTEPEIQILFYNEGDQYLTIRASS